MLGPRGRPRQEEGKELMLHSKNLAIFPSFLRGINEEKGTFSPIDKLTSGFSVEVQSFFESPSFPDS